MLLQCLIQILFIICVQTTDDTEFLTNNFFDNLEASLSGQTLTASNKYFIDKQSNNFLNLIKNTTSLSQNEKVRDKRAVQLEHLDNLIKNNKGRVVDELKPLTLLVPKEPVDIQLFFVDNLPLQYVAVLLKNQTLFIAEYQDNHFSVIQTLKNITKFSLHAVTSSVYLAVLGEEASDNKRITVYSVGNGGSITQIQTFDGKNATNIQVWGNKGELFMAVLRNDTATKEGSSTLYKWLGGHFDKLQEISTRNAVKIVPFSIGKHYFIAVVNGGNNRGKSHTYSVILKYHWHQEKFVKHQKLLSHGATDIAAFHLGGKSGKDHFLVLANSAGHNQKKQFTAKSVMYKYIDEYFIPFQTFNLEVRQWEPVTGMSGELTLIAVPARGTIKLFQYDGWKFMEAKKQFDLEVSSLHSYENVDGETELVVTYKNQRQSDPNFFQVILKDEMENRSYHSSMLAWCKKSISQVQESEVKVGQKPIQGNFEEFFAEKAALRDNESHDNIVNNNNADDSLLRKLENQMFLMNEISFAMDEKLRQIQSPTKVHVITGDIFADKVQLNNTFLTAISAEKFNDEDVDEFVSSVININDDFHLDNLTVQTINVESETIPNFLNSQPMSDYIHTNDMVGVDDLRVSKGVFEKGLEVGGELNGINFTREKVLLKSANQVLDGNINVTAIEIENATAKQLNELSLLDLNSEKTVKLSQIMNLRVKEMFIAGYLNNIDLPTLSKFSLKRSGNQRIAANYFFDSLTANGLETDQFINNRKMPDDLISISEGTFEMMPDVQFQLNLVTNELVVLDRVNEIQARDGRLDVLLLNSSAEQTVDGLKTVNNLNLLQPMYIRCKINGLGPKKVNPVQRVLKEKHILDNITIIGNVTIENLLKVVDMKSKDGKYSVNNLREYGLRTSEREIPMHLNFTQQLNVQEIFVDKINNIDPRTWIVNGNEDSQYIKGWKLFEGNLHITGTTNTLIANDINLPDMENNVLTIEGDQVMTGKHHIEYFNAEKITSDKITLGPHPWHNLLRNNNKDQFVAGTTTLRSLTANNIEIENLEVLGYINDNNLTAMLEDTVFVNSTRRIMGHKHFNNLTVDSLISRKSIDLKTIPQLIEKGESIVNGDLTIPVDLEIENVHFDGSLNGMSAEDFENNWLTSTEDHHNIKNPQYFESMILHGDAFVTLDKINGINLTELVEDSIKMDEEWSFGHVEFEGDLASESIKLIGQFEGLDVENMVAENGEPIQIESGIKFEDDVIVMDGIEVEGTINGLDLKALCEFSNPSEGETLKNLIINGNAHFMKGPVFETVNAINISKMLNNTWMSKEEMVFKQDMNFDQVFFEGDVFVKEYVDEVSLEWLQNNYFSRTKNQTVTAKFEFDDVLFNGSVKAPSATLKGTVNDVDLMEFVRTAILDGEDQIFEDKVMIEHCEIKNLEGDFTVNELNLEEDILRYNVSNIVTGKKTVRNIETSSFNINKNIKVQDVDVLDWIKSAVLKSGSFKLNGRISCDNVTEFKNGISLEGALNGKKFDQNSVLLKSVKQTIVDEKTFISTENIPSIFTRIKLKGRLNDIDVAELIRQQAFKNENTTLMSKMNIISKVKAQNVNFKGLYQGVNVTSLINNLTNSISLNNYFNNYGDLESTIKEVKKSLSNQAYYMDYQKIIQELYGFVAILPIRYFNDRFQLVALRVENDTSYVDFYEYNPVSESFSISLDSKEINMNSPLENLAVLEYGYESLLYLEYETIDVHGFERIGVIISNVNSTSMQVVASVPSNGTKQVIPLNFPGLEEEKACLLFLHKVKPFIDIICDDDDGMKVQQNVSVPGVTEVKTMNVDGCLHLIVLCKEYAWLWKYEKSTGLFVEYQKIFSVDPNSVSRVFYGGHHYLAISSKNIENTFYYGKISIKRFNKHTGFFEDWQDLNVDSPSQVEFARLPSGELVMFVLCDAPIASFVTYKYRGVSKFVESSSTSLFGNVESMQQFRDDNGNHFVIVRSDGTHKIIRTHFKGGKL